MLSWIPDIVQLSSAAAELHLAHLQSMLQCTLQADPVAFLSAVRHRQAHLLPGADCCEEPSRTAICSLQAV